MKKLLLLIFIVFVAFVVAHRQELFLRDPLAAVSIDGAKQSGAKVYINYSNDVLVEHPQVTGQRMILQHHEHAGTPERLTCLYRMACLTDADPAPLVEAFPVQVHVMSAKLVEFRDTSGRLVQITLR